jgi:hypothetical protein
MTNLRVTVCRIFSLQALLKALVIASASAAFKCACKISNLSVLNLSVKNQLYSKPADILVFPEIQINL